MLYLEIKYICRSKTSFNIKFNNHRKDIENSNVILAGKHFIKHDHDFNTHGKFIIIELLRNITTTKTETLKETSEQRKKILDNKN